MTWSPRMSSAFPDGGRRLGPCLILCRLTAVSGTRKATAYFPTAFWHACQIFAGVAGISM